MCMQFCSVGSAQGHSGRALVRYDRVAEALQVFFCGTFQTGQLQRRPTQKLSTVQLQPVTSACVPTSPVCACI